jgi:hypothetical protein
MKIKKQANRLVWGAYVVGGSILSGGLVVV